MRLTATSLMCSSILVTCAQASTMELTCSYPMYADPGTSHEFTVAGSKVEVTYGAIDTFALVGTKFALGLPGKPETATDLCEGRSAAGAGWQHTEFAKVLDGPSFIFNQAAGNAIGYQWGYSSPVDMSEGPEGAYIATSKWLPSYHDTTHGEDGFAATTPCEGNSAFYSELQRAVSASPHDDGNGGQVVRFKVGTKLKCVKTETWQYSHKIDAFYFDRPTARATDLAVYFKGRDGWRVGPISPFELWTREATKDGEGVDRGKMIGTSGLGGVGSEMHPDVEQVTFCVTVGGERLAFGVSDLPNGLALKVEETTYCADPDNDGCGNISLLVYQGADSEATYEEGHIREFELTWTIGSAEQLRSMGFYCE
jgi:hypothetical protein